jgi:hypothetical protein
VYNFHEIQENETTIYTYYNIAKEQIEIFKQISNNDNNETENNDNNETDNNEDIKIEKINGNFYIKNIKLIYKSCNDTFGEYKMFMIPEETTNNILAMKILEYIVNWGLF